MLSTSIAHISQQILDTHHALGEAIRDKVSMLEETQVYIGLNDADTRAQKLETDHYVSVLKTVCRMYGVPFSFNVVEGGYIHDDGEYTEERSIVLTLINVPQETVDEIAKELCVHFHQESVWVTTDRIRMRSVRETL